MLLSLISKLSIAKSFGTYYSLSENRIESDNYEIIKIINGEIDDIFYVEGIDAVLVKTGHYLWKINKKGYIVDTFFGANDLLDSGIQVSNNLWIKSEGKQYWTKRYNDWLYSGNKKYNIIRDIIEPDNLSDIDIINRLDKADIVEFIKYKKTNDIILKICLLKEKNKWVAIDITSRLGDIDERCYRRINNNYDIWDETCLEGYTKKYKQKLLPLENKLHYDQNLEDATQSFFIQKFTKDFYYYEEGFGGWLGMNILDRTILSELAGNPPDSFWYGTGYFQLNHNSEHLNFKSFVSNNNGRTYFNNISIYDLPVSSKSDLSFIKISYIGGEHNYLDKNKKLIKHHEDDVGLYVIRKKNNYNVILNNPSVYNSRNSWEPVFTGIELNNSITGNIDFFSNSIISRYYLLDSTFVPNKFHSIPKKISFNLPVDSIEDAFKLYLNSESIWMPLSSDDSVISIELKFNESEMVESFQSFSSANLPLNLEIRIKEISDVGGELSVWLKNKSKTIELKKVSYRDLKSSVIIEDKYSLKNYEKRKLIVEFNRALKNKKYIDDYFNISRNISETSPYIKEYMERLTYQVTLLVREYMNAKEYSFVEKIVTHYVNYFIPHLDKDNRIDNIELNLQVITSNALNVAILGENDYLARLVFNDLLGVGYAVRELKDEVLVFNIACYHALRNEKKLLLVAVEHALRLGKDSEQFMSDTDFRDYWDDIDFLGILKNRGQ